METFALVRVPFQIRSLSKKYGKQIRRTVHERSEKQVQEAKRWTEKIVGGVGVIAKKNGKYVLVKHTPEYRKHNHRYWSFPGGAVEHGEDFEEAAIREFREETGLDIEIVNLISIHEHISRSPQGNQSVLYVATFRGEVVGGEIEPEKPNEISMVRLFDEVPKKELVPWLRDTCPC